jgi:hypothetical protein
MSVSSYFVHWLVFIKLTYSTNIHRLTRQAMYVLSSKSFWPDIQKLQQIEIAAMDM